MWNDKNNNNNIYGDGDDDDGNRKAIFLIQMIFNGIK